MNQPRILNKLQHFYEKGIYFCRWPQLVGNEYPLLVGASASFWISTMMWISLERRSCGARTILGVDDEELRIKD